MMDGNKETWTLEEKIGQLFCMGFNGKVMNEHIKSMLYEKHVGNIILFSRNIHSLEQVKQLTQSLKKKMNPQLPLFITVDQENGIVSRMPEEDAGLPGARALGYIGDTAFTEEVSKTTAAMLKDLGIDMNLAPVLDVNSNRNNPVIGLRAFGEDKETVLKHGLAFLNGHESQGIAACAKHFPGHGDTSADSHLSLPIVNKSYEELLQEDVVPFQKAIDNGVPALLISHVVYPGLGETTLPATLSFKVITSFLRQKLKYDRVIVTDCLEMRAVSIRGVAEAAVQSFMAGADLLVISHTPEEQRKAVDLFTEKVRLGEIPEERVNESFHRIRKLKETYSHTQPQEVIDKHLLAEEGRRRSLFVKIPDGFLAVNRNQHIHVVQLIKQQRSMAEDQEKNKISFISPGFVVTESTDADGIADNSDFCVFVTDSDYGDREAAKMISTLQKSGKPLIVLAVRNSYILDDLPDIVGAAATFDPSPARVEEAFGKIIQTIYEDERGIL